MTMTNKLIDGLQQEIKNLGVNLQQHKLDDDEFLVNFCLAYVLAHIDTIMQGLISEDCNEQIK